MYDTEKAHEAARALQLPKPVGFHMLVALPEVKEKTDGGIIRPDETRSREETASIVGFVIAMGDDCYTDKKLFPTGAWCKAGDWVLIKPYTGIRVVIHGKEFRVLKDSEIAATVENPAGIVRSQRT